MTRNFEYIDINKELVPYDFTITLGEEDFKLDVRYNETYDFFTIDLYKDDEVVVVGEKLVYGMPLFADTYNPSTHPALTIIPLDPSGLEDKVNYKTLNETVFLIIQGGEEDE